MLTSGSIDSGSARLLWRFLSGAGRAAGDHEFFLWLSDARSCVRAVQRRVGYLRVEIEDANGATVSRTVSTKVGESESWLYAGNLQGED